MWAESSWTVCFEVSLPATTTLPDDGFRSPFSSFVRVVLPEPTGPPTPTRSGGSFLVRPGMACRDVMAIYLGM